MSDIKNLPNELLQFIFRFGARLAGEDQELPFPVSTSHVCRHWRELSLSTPDLWSRLNISILRPWEEERVRVYLERSRIALLDIRLSRHDWADESSQRHGKSCSMKMPIFISLLLPHIHRWRTLAINIDADTEEEGPYPTIIKQLNDHSAPKLEYLHVSVIEPVDRHEFIPRPIGPILVHGASALAKVRLRNAIAGEGSLPFQHVTTLDLGFSHKYTSPTEYSDIQWVLESSPHLEHLTLRGKLFHLEDNMSVIELPFLRSLRAVFATRVSTEYIHRLFTILSTPALKALELYANREYVLKAFFDAMKDSTLQFKFPGLETFGLAAFQGSSAISDDFFIAMPDVTHLRLLNGGSFDDLFDHLARNTAGRKAAHWVRLWPNLSTVTFLDCHHGQYTSLVNFLRKRRKINRPIRNIRIDSEFGNGMGKRSTNALRKLVEVEEIELKEERRMASTTQKIKPDCWYE